MECDNERDTRSVAAFFRRGRDADAWFKQALRGKPGSNRGQSTVEYAIVSAAFVAVLVGLGAFLDFLHDGAMAAHFVAAASHGLQGALGGVSDVFCY